MTNFQVLTHLFLQLVIIIIACRCMVFIGVRYFRQTEVVCEIIAGALLGPSFLGLFFPEIKNWIFPNNPIMLDGVLLFSHPSMLILYSLSHIGLVLYMFLIGLEFDHKIIKNKLKKTWIISWTGIIVPFIFGGLIAIFLYNSFKTIFFSPHVGIWPVIFFLGASLSITAFPVLARIIYERKLVQTNLGALTLAAASIDDAVAWFLLAVVLAIVKQNSSIIFSAIIGTTIYILFLFYVGNKLLKMFFKSNYFRHASSAVKLTYILILLMLCALYTDFIGVHSVFGAFVLGLSMPRGEITKLIKEMIEPLTISLLLPIFFVYSGLNTSIKLIDEANLWSITLLIVLVAIIGKTVSCTLAARFVGESWRESISIGTLMNTRGLMELIFLSIGLENNIITPTLFTIGVIMTIITTLMTTPLFDLINPKKKASNGLDSMGVCVSEHLGLKHQ